MSGKLAHLRRGLWVAATVAILMPDGHAQGVWRCGPEGRSYSDKPCPEGQPLQVADARSQSDVRAAQEAATREQRLAHSLSQDRRRREAEAPHTGAAGIGMPARPVFKPPVPVTQPKKRRQPRPHLAGADTSQAVAAASRPTRD